MRTCTGCRQVVPQRQLLRVAVASAGLVIDRARRLPGRGAYVHAAPACVSRAGLARSLRRAVSPQDIQQLVTELSRADDNSGRELASSGGSRSREAQAADPAENPHDLNAGLATAKPVETTSSE